MRTWALILVLLFSKNLMAFEEGQFKVGVTAGHVGLLQDVGNTAGNAIGVGGLLGYQVTDSFLLVAGYQQSSHTGLKHQDINVGLDWYFNSYDAAYFFTSLGTNFIAHELTTPGLTSNGFGLYAGFGADLEISSRFNLGLVGRYHNAFETSVRPAGSTTDIKAIQNYVTVGLRFTVALNGASR